MWIWRRCSCAGFEVSERTGFGERWKDLQVIVLRVPEEIAISAFFPCGYHFSAHVSGRMARCMPAKRLQPRAYNGIRTGGDLTEPVHRFADEILWGFARLGGTVHMEKMRGINHRRQDVAILRYFGDVLAAVSMRLTRSVFYSTTYTVASSEAFRVRASGAA